MGRVSRHCAAALWDEMVPPMDLRPAAWGLGDALTVPVQEARLEAALGRMEGRRSDGSCRQPQTGRQMKLFSRKGDPIARRRGNKALIRSRRPRTAQRGSHLPMGIMFLMYASPRCT